MNDYVYFDAYGHAARQSVKRKSLNTTKTKWTHF
jgi:hypothetical protein